MHGLQSARGYLQSKIAARLQTRVTPELRFEFDDSAKRTADLLRLIESTVSPEENESGLKTDSLATEATSDDAEDTDD
jgi:ribosome-binding factor A